MKTNQKGDKMPSTTNYAMFKHTTSNREDGIKEEWVQNLMRSISKRNLLHVKPIVVSKEFLIVDGQHRLEAAKRLKLPIYYLIDEDFEFQDIPILNARGTNNSWTNSDQLHFYVNEGYEEYEKFDEFIKQNKITINLAIYLLFGESRYHFKTFDEGDMKMPSICETYKRQIILNDIKNIKEELKTRYIGDKSFINSVVFFKALIGFLKEVDREIFKNKIKLKMEWLRVASSINTYRSMFKEIYNYRNKNPIQ